MTFGAAFLATWRAILTSRTLLSTMLLAVVLYAFYYPAPYAHEAPRKLPVVVVDQDASALSRAMIRDLDATRAVHVVAVTGDLRPARADMRSGKADGIILISDGLDASCRAGTAGSGIAVWVNATYLLRASTIGEAVTAVVQDIAKTRLLPGGQLDRGGPPVAVVEEPLFNRTGGYKGYVFPSVAVIIIQQTLLFGAATFMGGRRKAGCWRMGARGIWRHARRLRLGRHARLLFPVRPDLLGPGRCRSTGTCPALLMVVPIFATRGRRAGSAGGQHLRRGESGRSTFSARRRFPSSF